MKRVVYIEGLEREVRTEVLDIHGDCENPVSMSLV